jgi:hypothetical protein
MGRRAYLTFLVERPNRKDRRINRSIEKARRAKRLSKTRALKVRVRGILRNRSPSSVRRWRG